MNSNNDDENQDPNENNENQNSPFGFLSDMLSGIFSGQENGQGTSGMLGMFGSAKPDPIKIAKYFASEIAARDNLDPQYDNEDALAKEDGFDFSDALNENDFMSLMNQMRIMSNVTSQQISPIPVSSELQKRFENIFEAAKLYVVKATGSDLIMSLPLVIRDRIAFTNDYLDAMQEPLSIASKTLNPTIGSDGSDVGQAQTSQEFDIQAVIASSIAPMMFGVQAGTMIGHLSHRAYGDDDVLLPAKLDKRVSIIYSMVEKFASDWSIDIDEAILYFLIVQSVRAQIRNSGWLYEKLNELCTRYVGAYVLNPYKIEELLSNVEPDSENNVMAVNVTPEQMFEALRTGAHDVLDEEIGRITALHKAYVEYVAHKNIEELIPNANLIREARKRIVVTTSKAEHFVEQLFGVDVSTKNYEIAQTFVEGILERDQENALHAIWSNWDLIPTLSEFNAPGLYLARIEMMES